PLHSSQKELINNEEEYRIELNIIPNFEFQQQVLLHGDALKVLEPESLVQEIKNRLKNAYERYK
ncbi:MAG: WYL domain-containing protein, partial [Bacteroidetes bacterium 4572_77]